MNDSNLKHANPDVSFKTLSMLYYSLFVGQLLILTFCYFQAEDTTFHYDYSENMLLIAVPLMALVGMYGGNIIFKQGLPKLLTKEKQTDKLAGYTVLWLIRYAMIEGPVILTAVSFMLDEPGNLSFIGIAVALILYFITLRPTKDRMKQDLKI